jgi:hypothetical protein
MRRNNVISLRSTRELWLHVETSPAVGADVVHGCVDWYLYDERAPGACSRGSAANPEPGDPSAAPQSPARAALG